MRQIQPFYVAPTDLFNIDFNIIIPIQAYIFHVAPFFSEFPTNTLYAPLSYVIRNLTTNVNFLSSVVTQIELTDTRWRSWLRHCDKSRKDTGSVPDSVIGILH